MAEKTDAWMPLWIGAYLADTQHLTRDEHGAYLLLLMAYWRAGGPLPDEDKRLMSICKASSKEWRDLRPTMAEFFAVTDGVWTHKRVELELAQSQARKTQAASKAKAAAEARWKKDAKQGSGNASGDAPSNAPSMPQALHEQCPTPTPISSSLRSEDEAPRKRAAAAVAAASSQPDRPDDVDEQVWADWLALRRKKKAPVTGTVLAGARQEASTARLTLQRFLEIWCVRGSQGLQADWLTPAERGQPHRPAAPAGSHKFAAAAATIFGHSHGSEVIDV